MIHREIYLEKLRLLKDQNLIKVITGVRRCGKSTILEAFRTELIETGISDRDIIFYNFEERANIVIQDWAEIYDEIIIKTQGSGKKYIFLDEVQLIPNFEKLINSLFTKKHLDLYITGSNAYLLSSELATLLTGRYIAINMQTLSFKEYFSAYKEGKSRDFLFRQYLNTSSFPEAVNLSKSAPDLVNDYLQSIFDTVIKKDIILRHKLRNSHNLQRIIEFLFDSIGSIISPTNIAKQLNKNSDKKISHNTVIKLIDFLCESYILYPAKRYDIKGKELLSSLEKYYLVDLGLKNIVHSNKYDTNLGHKLENIVYFELLRRGGKVFIGKNQDKEIDFVVQKAGNNIEYYQVAFTLSSEKTFAREISALKNINDAYPKFILSMDYDNTVIDGIKKLNIIDWLLE
ncbi:MAG: ATP-binding protein [Bacteroidales bacterium]|nr:ATP-binding protein [Bacteroidales bacterium]MCK9499505.1 ATP-binding protein [Bacteroidales bacterium]MDY0314823.1 ATP-binding protein [Bacteroidales bacterium]NLB86301.1 ATP-binding protein [Bacteroidales bacterium]